MKRTRIVDVQTGAVLNETDDMDLFEVGDVLVNGTSNYDIVNLRFDSDQLVVEVTRRLAPLPGAGEFRRYLDTRAQLEKARDERERALDQRDEARRELDDLRGRINRARVALDPHGVGTMQSFVGPREIALRHALLTYGAHQDDCVLGRRLEAGVDNPGVPCTCGLDAALALK